MATLRERLVERRSKLIAQRDEVRNQRDREMAAIRDQLAAIDRAAGLLGEDIEAAYAALVAVGLVQEIG